MKRRHVVATILFTVLAMCGVTNASGDDRDRFGARLTGFEENTSISTTGRGRIAVEIDDDAEEIKFKLSYADLEGVAPTTPGGVVLFAHIHFSRPSVNGGVVAFLCGGGGKPTCPVQPATVEGTIRPADIIGPTDRGLSPGDFEEFTRAIRAGYTYANVHTTKYGPGEIRGQLCAVDDDDDDDEDDDDDDNEGDDDDETVNCQNPAGNN